MFNFLKKAQGKRTAGTGISEKGNDAGDLLAFISLCFLAIILVDFFKATNATAVISTYPGWIWGVILVVPALVSWIFFKSKTGLVASCSWIIFIFVTNDHLPALSRLGSTPDSLSNSNTHQSVRVLTSDCFSSEKLDSTHYATHKPGIVFLQGIRNDHNIDEFAKKLFGQNAVISQKDNCAVIADGGEILEIDKIPGVDSLIVEWKPGNSSMIVRLINLNLEYVDPFKSLFSPDSWAYYSKSRYQHRHQIKSIIQKIKEIESKRGEYPIIMAGNFAVKATSPVFTPLYSQLTDSYRAAGTSYGATFPADMPLFRFDRILASSMMRFQSSGTIYIPGCTRKAVYADIYPN